MSATKQYIKYDNAPVPIIKGAGGGKGGGSVAPNSLFSTDILYLTTALGEGPVYRIAPNGPQDIQIQDSAIDDLLNLDTDGTVDTSKFFISYSTGTTTQDYLPKFGNETVTPQGFASAVSLKKGNKEGIPTSEVTEQETSANNWDSLRFTFIVNVLYKGDSSGNVKSASATVRIEVFNHLMEPIVSKDVTISGKTDTAFKQSVTIDIPKNIVELPASQNGYKFNVTKVSNEPTNEYSKEDVRLAGWDEIKHVAQAFPRTAVVGYAIKATDEHTGGVPNFTTMLKGLIVKVPSNYNQPILATGEIDWRELEAPLTGLTYIKGSYYPIGYTQAGYRLQKSGTDTVLTTENPQIYVGTWDGSFVYSWTQNPIWIIYDILTNNTYGLGIPEENIDKYKFYQIAMYCDACESTTGKFMGVSGLADGSYRSKPRGLYTKVRENQLGLPKGTPIFERRFIMDVSITEQEKTLDVLNKLAATFRGILIYAGGKISLAIDMPEEYPVMLFNEATIKKGSFQLSGNKESDIYTGIDVTYIEPTNHFKRETIRIDTADANDGTDTSDSENIASIDLMGVTRRSQATRAGQYHIAASKYLRRNVSFTASTDALHLAPGDVISVSAQGTSVAYGHGGKVYSNSAINDASNTYVFLEHFTVPSMTDELFTSNTYPLALRVIKQNSDKLDMYIISDSDYSLSTVEVSSGFDKAKVKITSRFDPINKTIVDLVSGLPANMAPSAGDLWSLGEIPSPQNLYSSKAGKLFKVTSLKREANEEVVVSAVEYISNVYTDSDTFINYEPTSYTDISSPFSVPPTPVFDFVATPKTLLDGSVVVDGVLKSKSEAKGYGQKFQTEYYMATPDSTSVITGLVSSDPLVVTLANADGLANGLYSTRLSGKTGFSSPIGDIKLLCTEITRVAPDSIVLTVPGLSECIDVNFNKHILEVNDGSIPSIAGTDNIVLPVKDRDFSNVALNFVGYQPDYTLLSQPIVSYNNTLNTITIRDSLASNVTLYSKLYTDPFYVTLNQILAKDFYSNNSFYLNGSSFVSTKQGTLDLNLSTNTLELDVKPTSAAFVRLYIDGILTTPDEINLNLNISSNANVVYSLAPSVSMYRTEVDYYSVPAVEVGDLVEISQGNTFVVTSSSFDPASSDYNQNLTSNNIFRITLDETPDFDMSGYFLTNNALNPVGVTANVVGNQCELIYDREQYPGLVNLANNAVYKLEIGSVFEKLFLTEDLTISNLPLGTTSIRARNKNTLGRLSPFVEKSLEVLALPIQKVQNIEITESLYREQTGGVSVRVTCSFDHIVNQQVTDYEVSYKLNSAVAVGAEDDVAGLSSYNTVKVPASGVSIDGKIRFTVNNINRGEQAGATSITFKITPLNRQIRGISATVDRSIIGKTSAPSNIFNFTGGQQNEQITLLWQYPKTSYGDLVDLDLKEVVIRRADGIPNLSTSTDRLTAFSTASPLVSVSAGSVRKSVPIDIYGEYTYLARTKDSSGNYSNDVAHFTIKSIRPQRSSIVAAYSEDDPFYSFTNSLENRNSDEYYFTSFSNSITGGLAYAGSNNTDKANGSSYGWSVIGGAPTDLLAVDQAVYITPIRDFGQLVSGSISIDLAYTQQLQSSYYDQLENFANLVSESSSSANVLVDTNIGTLLGYGTPSLQGRYDANNRTWMTGSTNGNVWAIFSHGNFLGDSANANSYALVAGLINANAIALGQSYYANGMSTGSNNFANVTLQPASFTLVNFNQYNDLGTTTYIGDLGAVSSQTFIRTATDNVYYANSNVNSLAFTGGVVNDGFVPYEAGTKNFRYFQVKFVVTNNRPDEFDFTLDKLRYTIDKEQTIYSNTIAYSTSPTVVDFTSAKFITQPVISYSILDQIDAETNTAIVVTTALSNTSVEFKLYSSNGSGEYTANSSANIMVTVIGV